MMGSFNFTSPTQRHQDERIVVLLQVAFDSLSRYPWILASSLGIPGNILSVLVANRAHNRRLSPCIYMSAMAVADTILLLEITWFYSLFYSGYLDGLITNPELANKFHLYFMYTSSMLSGLFLAEMSIDRLIAVRVPMAASRLCTTKRAKVTVIISSLIIGTANLHVLYIYRYIRDPETGIRVMVFSTLRGVELVASLFYVLVGTVFPFLIILGSNLVIIVTLRRASKERARLKSSQQKEGPGKHQQETQHLTVMLIFVSVAYIVTSLPYRMYDFSAQIPAVDAMYDMSQVYWRLRYGIGQFAVMNIWFYNFAVNFYLYIIGGGKRYRNDAKEVLFC
ncbi:growth hormone secretagogue receptor type 1-like [Lineus longissimus]|uniref:growth hormone secretagogue receptor type 1-like n=1 Tax=Lineus longissimus TaxID=88925 RepID=UPI00315D8C18